MSFNHRKTVLDEKAASDQDTSQFTVLVVDDHVDSLFYAQQAVEIFGYRPLILEKGQQTLDMAKTHSPDIILLDICLRDITGFEVVAQLKQDRETAHIPVVAATALAADSDRAAAIAAGFDAFLAKPYTLNDLEAVLKQYIQRQVRPMQVSSSV